MSSLNRKQPLLINTINSPSRTYNYGTNYASEPDNYLHHHSHLSSPFMVNRRVRRRHKSKQKKLLSHKQDEVESSAMLDPNHLWISKLIKEDGIENKSIHCISVCKSYDLDKIELLFDSNEYFIFARYEDTIHFKPCNQMGKDKDEDNIAFIATEHDVFVFEYEGVIVFWNAKRSNVQYFASLLTEYQIDYFQQEFISKDVLPQTDEFDYSLGQDFQCENNEITLSLKNCFNEDYAEIWNDCFVNEYSINNNYEQKNDLDVDDDINWNNVRGILMMQKLAISFGLAQALKLTILEIRTEEMIDINRDIPKQMALNGKIGLKQKEIGQRMGRLFMIRSELNLHSTVPEIPDHFYEIDLFAEEFNKIREYLNINSRLEIINSRFELLHELFEIVSGQQETAHASKLEWIVIWLIVVEVILGLVELFKEYWDDL